MYTNQGKILQLMSLIVSLLFVGCGGGGGGGEVTVGTTNLSGVLTDGPISNAVVKLATLKNGSLASATTNEKGEYTLKVPNNVIDGLADTDLPYIHASSTDDSKVTTTGGQESELVKGQVSFRSILAVNQLKTLRSANRAAISTADTNESGDLQELARNLTISHVSNAKTLILETKLRAKGVLKEDQQIDPESFSAAVTIEETAITEALNQVEAVELALEDPASEENSKLVLLAAITKEMVEAGNVDLVTSSTTTAAKTNVAKLLLEIATESKELKADFKAKLNDRINHVRDDLNTRLKDSFKPTVISNFKAFDKDDLENAARRELKEVKELLANQVFRYSDLEMSSAKTSITVTYTAEGKDAKTIAVSQTSVSETTRNLSFTDKSNQANSIVFSFDTTSPTSLSLVSIGAESINTYIGKLKLGTTSVAAGVSVSLSKAVTSVSGSEALQKGRYFTLSVEANGSQWTLLLGSIKTNNGRVFPLGIVGIQGLFDSDTMYVLSEADIKGAKFPFVQGSVSEALNEFSRESAEGLNAAHKIALALKNSSVTATKRQANLIYAVTNLAMHLNDNVNKERSLTQLLDKLNVMGEGRNIFNFVAKMQAGGNFKLGDFKGISDIQYYFSSAPDGMVAALDKSIAAIKVVESTLDSTVNAGDEIMNFYWGGSNVSVQRKDIYIVRTAFHLLKFIMHFLSANNFDISDAAVTSLLASKDSSSGVTSFKDALEYYDQDGKIAPEIGMLEMLKADPNFLAARNNGVHFSGARLALLNALDQILRFIQDMQKLAGGDSNSAFYMTEAELNEIKETKKELLSVYNNINGAYHPTITIDGKGSNLWYSLNASEGKTLTFDADSTVRNNGPFNLQYIYESGASQWSMWDGVQQNVIQYSSMSFTKIDLNTLFRHSLRSMITAGSKPLTGLTTDDELPLLHFNETTKQLTGPLAELAPDTELIPIGDDVEPTAQAARVHMLPETSTVSVSLNLNTVSLMVNGTPDTSVDVSSTTSFRAYAKSYPSESVLTLNFDSEGTATGEIKNWGGLGVILHYSADRSFNAGSGDKFYHCWGPNNFGLDITTMEFSHCDGTNYVPTDRLINYYVENK